MKRLLPVVFGLCLWLETVFPVFGYEPLTHQEISDTAIVRSNLGQILKDRYGLTQGIESTVNGISVREWIAAGAFFEDVPSFRALNHFHNPLQPWSQAGGIGGESSIYWQQNSNQGFGGTWSWPVARRRFFDSLTLPSNRDREMALADTARALGQMMHLIQDATSPPHTRDDPHLIHDGYEARTEELRRENPTRFSQLLSAPPVFPSPLIFTPTGDARAPVSVARLIDSDTYGGTLGSYTTGGQIGAAEYTNGGYVSDDTIFLDFLLPRVTSLGPGFCDPPTDPPAPPPCPAGSRQYFPKVGDGDSVPHFVAEGTFFERLQFRGQAFGGFILEDRAYDDYAALLLPRAVGYSAALIDYFFRGKLKGVLQRVDGPVSESDSGIPFAPFRDFSPPYTVQLRLTNETEQETMEGDFRLYVERPDGTRAQLAEWTGQSLAAEETRIFDFTVPDGFGVAEQFFVVFQGRLGQEEGAVAGSLVGPEFLEEWDKDLTGNHLWGHTSTTSVLGADRDTGVSTNQVTGGRLIKDNNREAGDGNARFNESRVGPFFHPDGRVIRDFQDILPIPVTSRTEIEVKFNTRIEPEQPPCEPGFTCAYQYVEFYFSGGRFIQFSVPGQEVNFGSKGVYIDPTPLDPELATINIYEEFTKAGISVDNLILRHITLLQQLYPHFDVTTRSFSSPDPLPRNQHMEVDYIRVAERRTDADPGSGGEVVPGGGGSPVVGLAPSVTLTSPARGEVFEGEEITLSADATDGDGQVVSVEFAVNGVSQFVDTSAPFETQFVVPVGVNSLTITLTATDNNNNFTRVTHLVTVTPPPDIVITSPAEGATILEGDTILLSASTTNNFQAVSVEFTVNGVSQFVDTSAPFETLFEVPLGETSLFITATATDSQGRTTTATRVIPVQPDPPPTVVITEPAEGATVIEGSRLTLTAVATDNMRVDQVVWSVNGVARPANFTPPYERVVTVPTGVTSLTILATATDNLGRTGSAMRTIAVEPDRGTTVVGRVLGTDGQPYAGANVTVFGKFAARSQANGTFSISGVPTVRGPIIAVAAVLLGSTTLQGVSPPTPPVNDGITNVGDISMEPIELYPGRKLLVGNGPYSVAVVDLNLDGKLDLITSNSESDDVSVLLGNGDATFQAQQRFAAGGFPSAMAVADVNGDGFPDIMTANGGDGDISVLLGNGDGTFQAQRRFVVGEFPYAVAVADLNGDGFADIVTANNGTSDVSVLLGNGNGTFQPEQPFATGGGPGSLAIADFNGDGFPDLVTNTGSHNVSVLLGNGDGTFQTQQLFPVGDFPYAVTVADLNGDGFVDIATANGNSDDVSVLLGNGDGTFQAPRRFPVGRFPQAVAAADVNGDGFPDLVSTNGFSYDASVLLGNGDGTFQAEQVFAVGSFPVSVKIADLNGNGFPDIVTADADSDAVSILLGNGNGTFQDTQPPPRFAGGSFPSSLAAADLNGDGKQDIVAANAFQSIVSILLGNGDGTFQAQQILTAGSSPIAVVVADLNGDGLDDIVTANNGSNDVSVLLSNGGEDGGVSFQPQQRFSVGDFPFSVAVADLNGDSFPDIVTANDGSNDVSVLLGNGDGTFQAEQSFSVGEFPGSVAVADLNGDSFPDLVTANGGTNDVSVLLGNGDGTFQPQQSFAAGEFPLSVAVGDLNGDGFLDIVTANESSDVSVLLGNGDGTFRDQQRIGVGDIPSSVAIADLNGDGFLDIVTANADSDDVSVLLGRGDGTFLTEQPFAAGADPVPVTVVDLNGDGRPDLVVGNNFHLFRGVSVLLHR